MNIFSSIIITIVLISYPLIIYLFYAARNKSYNLEMRSIWLDIALFSSLYLIFKYDSFLHNTMMVINVPLIIAYSLKKRKTALLMGVLIIIYTKNNYDFNLIFLLFEYFVYYLVSYFIREKREFNYIVVFTILKLLFAIIYIMTIDDLNNYWDLIYIVNMFISATIVYLLIEIGDSIMQYHMEVKDLKEGKQFKKTIFNITHEIKNPLAVCKGYLDMLDNDNSKLNKYLPIIKKEINQSLLILQDFMNIERITINKEVMNINDLINEEKDSFTDLVKVRKGEIYFYLKEDSYIEGDYRRLYQVIINLIKNGIEASENPVINISTESDDKYAYINIKDNGVGMSEEELEKIKTPFYSTKKSGTGLGLSLCDEIIRAHNGKLLYESKKNIGTIVTIKIPKKEAN